MQRCMEVLAVVLAAAIASGAMPQAAAQDPWDDALGRIVSYEYGQSRAPLTAVADLCRATAESPAERSKLAADLAALLDSDATLAAKQFVCRQLALIGSEENVPALAALLL
ncbi:MAG: hypothetical protein JXR94_15050, partial [Candidatus Hydrogenedentes bacterium]|nr:hypothetical protein [Candidatus Hydrogenedentota bacterium]